MTTRVFAPIDDYVMGKRCSYCKAEPWQPCTPKPSIGSGGKGSIRVHAPRWNAGTRHRGSDIEKAPWPEDRIPGISYSTINYPARPAQVARASSTKEKGRS
jgi:hypothetical protein